jgi:hypothetical protein
MIQLHVFIGVMTPTKTNFLRTFFTGLTNDSVKLSELFWFMAGASVATISLDNLCINEVGPRLYSLNKVL